MTALDPHLLISQYGHTAWKSPEGLLSHPEAITQTTDGYIWIATLNGVFRFDGVKFTPWEPPDNQHLPSRGVHYLLGARDGSLWLGTPAGLSHFKAGHLTNYAAPGRYGISGIMEDHTGKIWVTRYRIADGGGALCWAKETTLECYEKKDGLPATYGLSLTEDSTGNIWFGCQRLCRWQHGSSTTYFDEQLKKPAGDGVEEVAATASGEVWAAIDGIGPKLGIQHFLNGRWTSYRIPGLDGSTIQDAVLFTDKNQTLWVGSASNGLYHVHDGFADHYGIAEGLTGKNIISFYEDMEGNIWVTTDQGLDLFHDNTVTTFSMTEGLSGADVHAVLAVKGDSVWVGSRGGLDVIHAGPSSTIRKQAIPGREVMSMFADSRGQIWLGIDDKIFVYGDGRYVEARMADGSALQKIGEAAAFAEDTDGNIWALSYSYVGDRQEYLLRIRDQRVQQKILLQNSHTSFLAADRRAGVWALAPNGELIHYVNGRVAESTKLDGVGNTLALDVDSHNDVWASTNRGLYRWSDGHASLLSGKNGLPCFNINSMIEDNNGSHWLRTPCGILHITAAEWHKWLKSSDTQIALTHLTGLDGAEAGQLQNQPAVAKTQDGRIWFAGASFIQMVAPNRPSSPPPPPVHIEAITADHQIYDVLKTVTLPHLRTELQIDYTALSFKIPSRVLFRYKLEGHDEEWQEAGTRRQAFYNDLPPGKYRFRVTACNGNGIWNEAGTSLDFRILPSYYQTVWFRSLCTTAVLLLLWCMYQLRIRQLRHQFHLALEARIDERTRIARDLHDTLLQSFQGLLLRFQTVSNLLPARPEEAKMRIDRVIEEGSSAITEGRDAVHELRSMGLATVDLPESIRSFAKELFGSLPDVSSPKFHVQVEGNPKDLNPVVRDEAYRIAVEAIRNAIRHADAQRIEVELRYDPDYLRLRIRDDGKGVDANVLDKEHAPGHWGLRGMRERAKLISGNFEIWSKAGSGTEIELKIPATGAYATPGASRGSFFSRS